MAKKITNSSLTEEHCIRVAKQYQTPTEWAKGDSYSYRIASEQGWRDACMAHMSRRRRKKAVVTLEQCLAMSSRHLTVAGWRKEDLRVYNTARDRPEWLRQCLRGMIFGPPPPAWTLAQARRIAAGYPSPGAWCQGHHASYRYATKQTWYKDCCAHMQSGRTGRKT